MTDTALRPLYISGFVLGFGLGGFLDGIILHQILQWHHMVSSLHPMDTLGGLQLNTFWDGLFHFAMYIITVIGIVLLWRAQRRSDVPYSPRSVIGAVLVGLGMFHVVDTVLNHWVLEVHHICYGENQAICDGGYLLIGLIALVGGAALIYQARPRTA